jgi:hypothetical protein
VARIAVVLVLVGSLIATGAVWTNAFGAGDRFERLVARVRLIVDPPPDRSIPPIVEVTEPPTAVGPPESAGPTLTLAPGQTPLPTATPGTQATPAPGSSPTPIPTPLPPRVPVDFALSLNPDKVFLKQQTNEWCAVAGTQIVLAIDGLANNSVSFQRELAGRIGEWESRRDSRDGGWGPAAIAAALNTFGAGGYEVRAYASRMTALRDAAASLSVTRAPVVMLSWRGAHTWIITGYRADADPQVFSDASVSGLYIYDPWYTWVSSIWEPALAPGAFHDLANLQRNFLPWDRPEGSYPDRDGKFILVVPTLPRPNLGA